DDDHCGDRVTGHLTINERHLATIILLALTAVGIAMAAAGRADLLGAHGWIIALAGLGTLVLLMRGYDAPEPDPQRLTEYYDAPTKFGIALTLAWGVVGMLFGAWVAWLLVYPEMTFDAPWASFGRLRPVHTSGVIFGFGGNAL